MKSFNKIALFSALLALVPVIVIAQNLTFDANTTINIADLSIDLTILNGGEVDSMTVNTGSVDFTMSGTQTVIIQSSDGNELTSTLGNPSTCSGATTILNVSVSGSPSRTITVTPSTDIKCTATGGSGSSGGGGGGGGGGGSTPVTPAPSHPNSGDVLKLACPDNAGVNDPCRSVYYIGRDGGRYVYPNSTTYLSWHGDFSAVKEMSAAEMASFPIRGNVTMRPGTYLIKITTDPKVYAVETGGVLRWVESETVAKRLWGDNWADMVVDVADTFFINYNSVNAVENKVTGLHPTGSIVKFVGSDTKYYMESGKRRRFITDNVFSMNGFREEFMINRPDDFGYEAGNDIVGQESILSTVAGRL